jgi:hypothetical protein
MTERKLHRLWQSDQDDFLLASIFVLFGLVYSDKVKLKEQLYNLLVEFLSYNNQCSVSSPYDGK